MYQYRINDTEKQLVHFLQISRSPSYTFIPSPLNILIFQTSDQYPTTFHPILTIILSYSQLKIFQTLDQYILIHFSSDFFTIILSHSQLKIFQTSDQYILIHFSSDLDHHPFPFPIKNFSNIRSISLPTFRPILTIILSHSQLKILIPKTTSKSTYRFNSIQKFIRASSLCLVILNRKGGISTTKGLIRTA